MTAATRTPTRFRMRIPQDIAGKLDRYVSAIVADLRRRFEDRGKNRSADGSRAVVLDLTGVSEVPHSALILLVTLLRRTLGDDVAITLTGVGPAVLAPLTALEFPPGVEVIDSRRRRWPG